MNIKTLKKPLLVAGAVTTIGITGITGLGVASAATNTSSDSLVSKIATKFNLKEADVQAVFDEDRTTHEQELKVELSDQLQDAVDSGKITADQKTKIEAKIKEIQAARETEMSDLEEWADQQGVDLKHAMRLGGPKGGDDRLQSAVDDGDITADQKTAIEAKQKELQTKRDSDRTALEKWATDNGIDTQYLMKFGGPGGHGGPDGPGKRM